MYTSRVEPEVLRFVDTRWAAMASHVISFMWVCSQVNQCKAAIDMQVPFEWLPVVGDVYVCDMHVWQRSTYSMSGFPICIHTYIMSAFKVSVRGSAYIYVYIES